MEEQVSNSEDRGQKTEDRGQKTEVEGHVGWVERSETHLSFQEDGRLRSEVRRRRTEDRAEILSSDLCPPY